MKDIRNTDQPLPREACKLVTCVLPDDGTDRKLMRALRDEKQITRANSTNCLGLAILADARTRFDALPEPILARKVEVVVPEADADDLYDYIFEKAQIGRPRGGVIWLGALYLASPFLLPGGVPAEEP
jgi:nitrogen regulatory protein PII